MDLNQEQQFGKAAAALQDQAGGLLRAGAAMGQIAGQAYSTNATMPVLRTVGDKLDNSIRQAEREVERLKEIKVTTPAWLLSYKLDEFYKLKTI